MHRQSEQKLVEELLPRGSSLRCIGASYAVGQLDQRHHRDSHILASYTSGDFEQRLARILAVALGGDEHAGVEDQSHAGGFKGSRCAAAAPSTSRAKSSSMVASESSGNRAIHSAMERRGGVGV